MSELQLMVVLNFVLVVAFIVKDVLHARSYKATIDGISKYMKQVHEDTWRQSEFTADRLRGELERAQAKVIGLRRSRTSAPVGPPPTSPQDDSTVTPRAPSNRRSNKRHDLEHATIGGNV